MQGRTSDPDRAREVMNAEDSDATGRASAPTSSARLWLGHDDDAWTMAIYFTSEAEAREGEQKEPPPEMQQMMQELESLAVGETSYLDIKDPWLSSPS